MVPQSDFNMSIEIFPYLTNEKRSEIQIILNSMDEKIFNPIMESKDIEKTIENKINDYNFYLSQIYMIFPEIMENFKKTEFLDKIYQFLREEIQTKVLERDTRRLLLKSMNLTEEHDRYILDFHSNLDKYMELIDKIGSEVYSNLAIKISLIVTVIFIAIDRKHESLKELSKILNNFTDELEPFIATFQVFLEPELAPLREKTSYSNFMNAKELRGSYLEKVEN